MKKFSEAASNIDGQPMFKLLDRARQLESQGRSILHFEIGDPDFRTPDNIVRAASEAMQNGFTHYTSSLGTIDFRRAICKATQVSRGFEPQMDQVLVTPGANIAIFYAVFCLVDPGCEVIVPDPGFPTYYSTIKMCGAVPVRVPLKEENGFRMNPADVEKRITDKTRLIIINSPHNPTGSVMTGEEIREMYRLAEKYDLYLYSDEIYARMIYDEAGFHSPSVYDRCLERTIVSNGFSKAFAMTGWRLGAVIGPPDVIERMGLLLQTTSSCVSPFIQMAGVEAITGDQAPVKAMMTEYRARRDILVGGLNAIPGFSCLTPGGAFYAFANIRETGMSSEAIADYLLEDAGVAVLPGTNFGEYGEGYIRLCYATAKNDINEAVARIRSSMEKETSKL